MKASSLLLGAALVAAAPSVFAIDRVTIKNGTERVLHYKMRCVDTGSGWKAFEAQPGEIREISAQSCQQFAFEKSTTKPDGAVETVKYVLQANTRHIMVYDNNKQRWDLRRVQQTDF